MSGVNLIPSQAQRDNLENLVDSVWQTFKRAFQLFVEAQTASIITDPNFSRFGQRDQNVFNPAVTPQYTTVMGTILYGNKQPWEYIAPENRTNYMQDKIRNSDGIVRIKVDADGYALMQDCKLVVLDGFNFKLNSTARPHGLFSPLRYTFTLEGTD